MSLSRQGPSARYEVNLLLGACEGCSSARVRDRLRSAVEALAAGRRIEGRDLLRSMIGLEAVLAADWRLAVLIWLHLEAGAIGREALEAALGALAADAEALATFTQPC